jgi:hypothetical protein
MKNLFLLLGPLALVLTIGPPILFLTGSITDATVRGLMLVGCILWFVAAPGFMSGGDR